ncbi:MAG: molybdopterin molybdotransferase MoeA [Candidatus Competibacteraceae bacterium]|nr:molybdopterin molybdotransferase MoeA [Candidatus Competibacteraceae bacterium]
MANDALTTQPSCADDYDPNSLPVSAALDRIDTLVEPVTGHERLALRQALGRVLAETITSPLDVPAHTNSAMDGYAVCSADLPGEGTGELAIIGSAFAGAPFQGQGKPGTTVRIMTGAVLPQGYDTVVMQEHVQRNGERLRIGSGHKPGQNVRQAGEDLARGGVVYRPGQLIRPAQLGVLASLGINELRVRRRPRVAFFSTGDELRCLGQSLGPGEIYDSNRYTLYGMLARLGVELLDMGVVRDDPQELEMALREASQAADAIITSGGVSVGEADFVKDILDRLGRVDFWKIAMKPGRPLAFGRVGEALFFGLPGNPVSVMVTFYQFVQPALRRMMGQLETREVRVQVPCLSRLKKRPGRTEFQRGVLEQQADGSLVVRSTGQQGSGILSSVSQANCFIVLPEEWGEVAAGTLVEVQPFEGLV